MTIWVEDPQKYDTNFIAYLVTTRVSQSIGWTFFLFNVKATDICRNIRVQSTQTRAASVPRLYLALSLALFGIPCLYYPSPS
jgi:hypothetical protein